MKTEGWNWRKNSVSQESKKARRFSSHQLSRLPTISKRNSKQKPTRTREKRAVESTFTRNKTII
jgi:hypothetical protein